jgi:hypothetical protein
MEVEFSMTPDDVRAFYAHHKRMRAKERQMGVLGNVVLAVVGAGMALAYQFVELPDRLNWLIVGGLCGLLLAVVGLAFLASWLVRRDNKKYFTDPRNQWLFGRRIVRISPEGLTTRAEGHKESIEWSVIWLNATSDYIFFQSTTRTGTPVPRRAFRDREHFEDFIALAREYHQGQSIDEGPRPTGITGLPRSPTDIFRPENP